MNLELLFYAGIVIFTGLFFGKLAKRVHLPNVTGYLVGGLILRLVGPLIGFQTVEMVGDLELISNIALGFIAFSIGNELKASYFKQVGSRPIVIAIFESLFAVVFVFGACIVYYGLTKDNGGLANIENIQFSLILSAIAAATAPAATLLVVRQYRAKGPLTETLLSVVALDDSTALMMFGINVAIANMLNNNSGASVLTMILEPIYEIVLSLVIGAAIGVILTLLSKWFSNKGNRISLMVASIFVTFFVADYFGGSSLLACMALGGIFANLFKEYDQASGLMDYITPPIFTMFFVISGAGLDYTVLFTVGAIGFLYVIFRVAGKIFGSWFGSAITHAEPTVRKYLGYALIPQAGVAIGLSLIATEILNEMWGNYVRAIVLSATLIYELTGPIITKITLKKSGEIAPEH